MKIARFLIVLFALSCSAKAATSFTEWYVDNAVGTGANTNSGSTATSPVLSLVSGDWVQGTCVFTKAGADLSTIDNTMWASVYANGATVAAYVAKIVTVDDGADTITLSTTAKAGTSPGDSTGGISITVGGPWSGPSGSVAFPFNFATMMLTNSSGDAPRVNLKAGNQYNITNAMTHTLAGPIWFQGYTSSPGDGGKATIDGGTTGTSYVLLTASGVNVCLADLIFANNGASGTSSGVTMSGAEFLLWRCVMHNFRNSGAYLNAVGIVSECESYSNNIANTGTQGGFLSDPAGVIYHRCIAHHNIGSAASGFVVSTGGGYFFNCIANSNGKEGFLFATPSYAAMNACDAYNNGDDGMDMTGTTNVMAFIQNCNFIKNTGYGINSSGSKIRNGYILNCGFGSGTQTNSSGSINAAIKTLNEIGSVTYAADQTPWSDPANGDFRITLAAAKNAGRGAFTATASGYSTNTLAYPDIGAAQHQSTSGSSGSAHPWAQ